MVNEAILGALRSALERKESLKKAMMTLYNAGYKKEEISEAAKVVNQPSSMPQTQPIQQITQKPSLKSSIKMLGAGKSTKSKKQPKQVSQYLPTQQVAPTTQQPMQQAQTSQQQIPQQPQVQQPMQQQQPVQNAPQNVSGYAQPPKPGSKTTIIILGGVLLFLLGALVTIFLFKDELLNFFNNLFN